MPEAGPDDLTLHSLGGTGVQDVVVGLGLAGGGGPDASPDVVNALGTGGGDNLSALAHGTTVEVAGLGPSILVEDSVAADRVVLSGGGGDDTLSAGASSAFAAHPRRRGRHDTLNGGNGADCSRWRGNDTVDGNNGDDIARSATATTPSSGTRATGRTPSRARGAPTRSCSTARPSARPSRPNPTVAASCSPGPRATSTMDLNDTEVLTVNALGAADNIIVDPLGATDLRRFNLNLGVSGAVDGAIDTVTVNGTTGDDTFQVTGAGTNTFAVRQPGFDVVVALGELANDTVTINGSSGNDGFFSSSNGISLARFTFNGGNSADVLVGTAGDDTLNGDAGNDRLFGEAGTTP